MGRSFGTASIIRYKRHGWYTSQWREGTTSRIPAMSSYTNVNTPIQDDAIAGDIFAGFKPVSLKVSDAPWSRFLMVEEGIFSPEKRFVFACLLHCSLPLKGLVCSRYRIMVAVQKVFIARVPVDCIDSEPGPLNRLEDFSRGRAEVVFAHLPSGYCKSSNIC